MTDFRLRPSSRSPGSGRDFRLYPGWTGAAVEAAVGGTALAPAGRASGALQASFVVTVGGVSAAHPAIALGTVAIRRFIAVTARARWAGLEAAPILARAAWPPLISPPVLIRARWPGLIPAAAAARAAWPGLPSVQNILRARWSGLIPAAVAARAAWPGLPSVQNILRARWSGLIPAAAAARARWNDLTTPVRFFRARWSGLEAAPTARARARWNDLATPWVRYRARWGRLIAPPWVWPRPQKPIYPDPVLPTPVADTFRLYLRNALAAYDFRLRLGGPFLVTTRRSLLMQPHCLLYRLSDNLPLEGKTLDLSADRDSYGWTATLTTTSEATIEALFASDPPQSFAAIVNGHVFHLQPLTFRQTLAFGTRTFVVAANSRTALLDAPFAEATTGTVAAALTARQIAEAALAGTGFALQWDCPVDPALPAGRVTWRDATPKQRVAAIATSLGATLQSARAADTLRVTPRRILAPWEMAGQVPEVVLEGALIIDSTLGRAEPMQEDCVFVSGTESGFLVKVTRAGTAGERPAATVTDPLLTEILACRERGRQALAARANRKSLSVGTILNSAGSPPGVLEPGALVEVVVGTARWLDEVMSCAIKVQFGKVTQTLGFGEERGNEFVRLQKLLPTDPLLVGTVIAVWPDGTRTVELPGGGELRVSGDSVAEGARVYVQGGKIQGEAPALPTASVEV